MRQLPRMLRQELSQLQSFSKLQAERLSDQASLRTKTSQNKSADTEVFCEAMRAQSSRAEQKPAISLFGPDFSQISLANISESPDP